MLSPEEAEAPVLVLATGTVVGSGAGAIVGSGVGAIVGVAVGLGVGVGVGSGVADGKPVAVAEGDGDGVGAESICGDGTMLTPRTITTTLMAVINNLFGALYLIASIIPNKKNGNETNIRKIPMPDVSPKREKA